MGTPSSLPGMWACWLLRFVQEQARHQALPCDEPPDRSIISTRRRLALVLHRPDNAVGTAFIPACVGCAYSCTVSLSHLHVSGIACLRASANSSISVISSRKTA